MNVWTKPITSYEDIPLSATTELTPIPARPHQPIFVSVIAVILSLMAILGTSTWYGPALYARVWGWFTEANDVFWSAVWTAVLR